MKMYNQETINFLNLLSPKTRELIHNQITLIKKAKEYDVINSKLFYYKNNAEQKKLIIDKRTSMHKTSFNNLDGIAETGSILPAAMISGCLSDNFDGNIAPFCTHFVNTPRSIRIEDYTNFFNNYSSINKAFTFEYNSEDLNRKITDFCSDMSNFLDFRNIVRISNCDQSKSSPIIFISDFNHLKNAKYQLLDVLGCNGTWWQQDFHDNASDFFHGSDFNDHWENYVLRHSAIIAGVPTNYVEGIIINHKLYDKFENSIHSMFPHMYIVDETGTILYTPKNCTLIPINIPSMVEGDIFNNGELLESSFNEKAPQLIKKI